MTPRAAVDDQSALKIRRHFTTEGVHPYDEVEWELRDAVIKNYRTGVVAFEQQGVEIPKAWSQNATNIATQKYFRGSPGTPERERSVKQMIDRVVNRYHEEGLARGYFADDDEAQIFKDELTHLLVTQKAAFNSPVWFNVGWRPKGQEQVAACFILKVEDEMDSILNWYAEEGRIFKHGSGAGINLSRIRSSKERLKSGGTASGPVSFMRGADASAGTIKSGGATRRAAKMVVLDVGHPDIKDFIWCKALEEHKARALSAAGFDMDLDGADSHSIQYQNANNSVRVDDTFMQAVLDDGDYELKAITTGETIETVPARALMRELADAAWQCADPGMQYDTTINDWHTCPNTERINASNPCSEYLHLDNSACNLASLNLMKFLDDEDHFDIDAFKHAVEVVFLAQEISVGFASYPTEAIGDNSQKFRQLGQGYANLGALLMTQGLAYDSDEGRAWAGAITALMTGHCYVTSAKIAKRMGAFEEYKTNEAPMLRVIGKHRDAAYQIADGKAPEHLIVAARESWDRALSLGTEHGYRNAQATVLAPTGCLVGGTLVPTERGLVRLGSLGDVDGEQWQDLGIKVNTDEGPRDATKFYVNGLEAVVDVTTARGYRIKGTPKHRIKIVAEDGSWAWKRFGEIAEGDLVPLALDQLIGEPQEVTLPPLPEAYWTGEHHARAPRRMTPELAELLGYFMGDGSLHSRGLRFCVADGDFDVVERLSFLGKELFGLEAHTAQRTGYTEVALHSVRLVEWWGACGFAKGVPSEGHPGKGYVPHLPSALLYSNDRDVYGGFIRGLFEADGTVTSGYPCWSTTAVGFSHDVQSLLLALGFPTTRKFDKTGWSNADLAVLRLINTGYNERFLSEIGFMSDRKNAAVAVKNSEQSARKDKIPFTRALIDRLAPDNGRIRKVLMLERSRTGSVSRRIASELFDDTNDAELGYLLRFFYDRVAVAELGEDELTYDLSVPDNVTYLANGFVSHNTIGLLMDCDTTGIEPDLALKKTKKLVGGGTMSIVNQSVPRALRKLGYDAAQVTDIIAFIDDNSHVVGAPHLRDEHMTVFDTAMGDRSINYMGHIKMMAAAQPFLSGAISKCVTEGTLLATGDGLVRIGGLYQGESPNSFRDDIMEVASLNGSHKTDAFYYGGIRPVRKVVTRSGHNVTGTNNHRLFVAGNGGLEWRRLDEIQPGDYVALQYGSDLWSSLPARFDGFKPSRMYGSQKAVRVPTEMTQELAFLLGAFASEGHITRSNWTIHITNSEDLVLERVRAAWVSEFGVGARIVRQPNKCPQVSISSKTIVEFLDYLGCGTHSFNKRIPDAVLKSPRSMVLSFLSGLFLDAYAHPGAAAKVGLCLDSAGLLDDYQAVLTNLGIVHGRIRKFDPKYDKYFGEVYAAGQQAQRLLLLVPFIEPSKRERVSRLLQQSFDSGTSDVVPGMTGRQLYELVPRSKSGRYGKSLRKSLRFLLDPRTKHVSRRTIERVAHLPGVELPSWLQSVLDDNLHFTPVESVADAGEQEVFDISVPETHAFVGNGIVNHNTVNLPENVTIEDVETAYMEGWRLGLKALAIYRDNCKAAQPLSVTKKDVKVEPEVKPTDVPQPVRQRLPKKRRSQTIKFRVADTEGYINVGEYDDGSVGELFLKVAKQGSTLAGIMDAFAISISMGLQYGVPLSAYVKQFVGTRFEPSGMTDDPDFRIATSVLDYVFRVLAFEYMPPEERHALGIKASGERQAEIEGKLTETPLADGDSANGHTNGNGNGNGHSKPQGVVVLGPVADDASTGSRPYCGTCGVEMNPSGSCFACPSCGSTSGCS